jgi:hypothetical protein
VSLTKQQALASGGVNEALAVLLSVSSGQVNSLQLAGGGGGGEGLQQMQISSGFSNSDKNEVIHEVETLGTGQKH